MKLSKEAKDGFEWAVKEVKYCLDQGSTPEKSLKIVGIKNWEDTLYFMEYLRDTNRKVLLNRLTKSHD